MNFEFYILDLIQEKLTCPFLDWLMPKVTFLGNAGWIWIAAALILICMKKYRMYGVQLGIGLMVGFIIGNLFLKNIVMRERPCWINDNIQLLIPMPMDYSFPSGHTLSSFVSAGILIQRNLKIGFCAYILAVLIGFSRLYLYVHFPTDVLTGIVFGTIIAFVTVYMSKKIIRKRADFNN